MRITIIMRTGIYLSLFFLLMSCQENEINPDYQALELNDEDIAIDETSVFNMLKFIETWDKVVYPDRKYSHKFSHTSEEGMVYHSSYDNKLHGEFGKGFVKVTHDYNNNGVINSSLLIKHGKHEDTGIRFEYEFDARGKISIIFEYHGSALNQKIKVQYDQNENPSFIEYYDHADELQHTSYFTFDKNGHMKSYDTERFGYELNYQYTYDENSNIVLITGTEVSSSTNVEVREEFTYDSQNRLIERARTDRHPERISTYEYSTEKMIHTSYNIQSKISIISEMEKHLIFLNKLSYDYDANYNFKGLVEVEYENGFSTKGFYYAGNTMENLSLTGYGLLEYDHIGNRMLIEVFNENDQLSYFLDYNNGYGNWFLADGSSIESNQVPEWVKNIYFSMY